MVYHFFLPRLRQFRRAESLSIIIDDVLGRDSVERTLERTTVLAERCIEVAFAAARAELVARHGEPRDEDGVVQSLIVYGLGKLGSRELNFSSDIDLIAAFPRAGETDGRRALDNEDIFARLVQRASTLLGETTADGRITLIPEEECLAACTGSPMMAVDGHYHENLTLAKVDELLDGLE